MKGISRAAGWPLGLVLSCLVLPLSGARAGESVMLKKWRQDAEAGDAFAMTSIGVAYSNGTHGLAQDHASALAWFRKGAAGGNVDAMNNIGITYENGYGVEADPIEAYQWFRKAAEAGSGGAQYSMGHGYYQGRLMKKDFAEAERWFRRSADQGYVPAMRMVGVLNYLQYQETGREENAEQAERWMRKAAERGDAVAQFNLGVCHEKGVGVAEDQAEAFRWYMLAAEKDDAAAQLALGRNYRDGRGVERNLAEARRWLKAAAANGKEVAAEELAELAGKGDAPPKPDRPAASLDGRWSGKAWGPDISGLLDFAMELRRTGGGYAGTVELEKGKGRVERAALDKDGAAVVEAAVEMDGKKLGFTVRGKPNGDRWEGELDARGPDGKPAAALRFEAARGGGKIGPADGETDKAWVARKMADAGDAAAMTKLGGYYFQGREGLAKDVGRAVEWFGKAAAAGDAAAAYNLGAFYKAGVGVPKNPVEAYGWFKRAAERGDADALEEVGFAHMKGRGVPEDLDEAERWFLKAAEKGSSNAAMQVGNIATLRMRERGADAKGAEEAIRWYRRAAAGGEPAAMYNLAVLYNNGSGVAEDFAEAGYWYERAARNGEAPAQYRLGVYYLEGKGRAKDLGKAKRWLAEALANGDQRAQKDLARIPDGVEAVGDQPVRVAAERLSADFAADAKTASARYRGRVLDVIPPKGAAEIDMRGSVLTIGAGPSPLKLRCLVAKQAGGRTFAIGQPIRGFCGGLEDGAVLLDACRFIQPKEAAPETAP